MDLIVRLLSLAAGKIKVLLQIIFGLTAILAALLWITSKVDSPIINTFRNVVLEALREAKRLLLG